MAAFMAFDISPKTDCVELKGRFITYNSVIIILFIICSVIYLTKHILKHRCFWIVAVILSIGLSGSMVRDIWVEWENHPVTIVEHESVYYWDIPYPTVTICPETKMLRHKLDIASALGNLSALSTTE